MELHCGLACEAARDQNTEELKRCTQCKVEKPLTEYSPDRGSSDGRASHCRMCHRRYTTSYSSLSRHGMTRSQYDEMLAKQGGVCAICGGPPKGRGKRFYVDHDHETNHVRGLLCSSCNSGLGQFQDNIAILRSAIAYLKPLEKRFIKAGYRKDGRCVSCGAPRLPGRSSCAGCLESTRLIMAAAQAADGITARLPVCTVCGRFGHNALAHRESATSVRRFGKLDDA